MPKVAQISSATSDEASYDDDARAANSDFGIAYRLKTAVWVFDIDTRRILWANEAACLLWQATSEAELQARDLGQDMSRTVEKRLRQYQEDFARGAVFNEVWTLYPNGVPESVVVNFHGYPLPDGRMTMLCEVCNKSDDAPENLRSAEALLHTDIKIALYHRDGPPLYMNPAARNSAGDLDQSLREIFVDPRDFDQMMFELDRAGEHAMMTKIYTENGLRWHDMYCKSCLDAATGAPAILVTSNDVSALKHASDKARYLADRDQLTSCFNRTYLLHHIEEKSKFQSGKSAIIYFDIDRFKQINDRYGHDMGDTVLRTTVSRATASTDRKDIIARIGGDEFAVLVEDIQDEDAFAEKVQKLQNSLARPVANNTTRVDVTVSIGVAFFSKDDRSFTTILRDADIALYSSKARGRNCITYFDQDLGRAAKDRDDLEIELKTAIERREFVLFYQPRIDLSSGRIVSAEALVRWQHPKHGLIYPDKFISVCEETDMIQDLGRIVLEEGCRQAIAWQNEGLHIGVSINVSPKQFDDADFLDTLQRMSELPGFPEDCVELEITENVLVGNPGKIAEKLHQITSMGYKIAVDDFGVGYSNLSYISHFPLECIKIDRSFIEQLPGSGPVIQLILTLAKKIGAKTVAEGVEDQASVDWLSTQDCDQVQGYFYSRPVPLGELRAVIDRNRLH